MTAQKADPKVIARTTTILTAGTWFLAAGVVTYSLMTTTPFVADHSAEGWEWSAFLLGLMVDVAFVMALQADSVLSSYGVQEDTHWPRTFRWFTGGASVFLNVGISVSHRDWVGVVIHLIAPALLLIVAEVGPVYRRSLAGVLARAEIPQEPPAVQTDTPTPVPASSGHLEAFAPAAEAVQEDAKEAAPEPERLSQEEARHVIEDGWTRSRSVRETAAAATRSASYVGTQFKKLDQERGPRPMAGQLHAVAR